MQPVQGRQVGFTASEFQSLIGRLATLRLGLPAVGTVTFQSLIGRLATYEVFGFKAIAMIFQSLIGRLATRVLRGMAPRALQDFNPS